MNTTYDSVSSMKAKIISLTTRIKKLEKENSGLTEYKNQIGPLMQKLINENKNQKNVIYELNSQISKKNNETLVLKVKYKNTINELTQRNNEYEAKIKSLNANKQYNSPYKNENNKYSKENFNQATDLLKQSQSKIIQLKNQLKEKDERISLLEGKLCKYRSKLQIKPSLNEGVNQKNLEIKEENQNLKNQLKTVINETEKIKELEIKIYKISDEFKAKEKELKQNNALLAQKYIECDNLMKSYKLKYEKLAQSKNDKNEKITLLKNELLNAQNLLKSQLNKDENDKLNENYRLRQQILELKADLQKFQSMYNQINEELRREKEENKSNHDDDYTLNIEKKQKNEYDEIMKENILLKKQIQEMKLNNQNIKSMQDENLHLKALIKKELDKKNEEINELNSLIELNQIEIKQIKNQNTELKKQGIELENINNQLTSQNRELRNQNNQLINQLNSANDAFESEKKKHLLTVQSNKINEISVSKLKNDLLDINNSFIQMKNDFDDLLSSLENSQIKDILISRLKERINDLNSIIQNGKDENKGLINQLVNDNDEKQSTIESLNEKINKLISNKNNNSENYDDLIEIKQDVSALHTELMTIYEEVEKQERENSIKEVIIEKLKERIDELYLNSSISTK